MPDRWHGDDVPVKEYGGGWKYPAPKPDNFEALWNATYFGDEVALAAELATYQKQLDDCGYLGPMVTPDEWRP
jgi:hypothetical protein